MRKFISFCFISICMLSSCGFGLYSDSGAAEPGQWWPWVCTDGSAPAGAIVSNDYIATGTCGAGGNITITVDGCSLFADWSVLGLSNVETVKKSDNPDLGGWSIQSDTTTCTVAAVSTPSTLSLVCNTGCQSSLTPVQQ